MKKNITIKTFFFIALMLYCFNAFVSPVHADALDGAIDNLQQFNETAQLSQNEDLAQTIINIINIVLSFLALIFVILILYGGFTYMTAAGSQENIKKATDILKNSVVGVIIIVLSGIFVNYVLDTILPQIL
jgi:hypothetical protein